MIWKLLRIPQRRQRVRARGLPPLTEALREGRLQSMVIGPALEELPGRRAPFRNRPLADVTEGIVGPRGGVVTQVHVGVALLASPGGIDIIRLERHRGPQLPLYTHRGLIAVRMLAPRMVDFKREVTSQTPPAGIDVAHVRPH